MSIEANAPQEVFHYFNSICKIPHDSGNEMALSHYIKAFAERLGLYVTQDKAFNLIIKKPACGEQCANLAPVILQGHLDMVCEKAADSMHDFFTDPIIPQVDGDFIHANGTTLGADNGIAVAYAMALLAAKDIPHPPLEVLLTTSEETGMFGAEAVDASVLSGKRLINIDSEEEGYITVSCAGGMRTNLSLPIIWENNTQHTYCVRIEGLLGGHSGMEIIKQRANANKLMGRVLSRLNSDCGISLAKLCGGAKDNAIARAASAIFTSGASYDKLYSAIAEIEAILQNEYRSAGDTVKLTLEKSEPMLQCFDKLTTSRAISALLLIPNGVISMSLDIDGLVESSSNLGIVATDNTAVSFMSSTRSSVATRKNLLSEQFAALALLLGAEYSESGKYPAWEYRKNSSLERTLCEIYEGMYGDKPKIFAIHAGLECGILSEKMPDCEMVSIGPDLFDVHTPSERMSISSVARTWDYLKAVLAAL